MQYLALNGFRHPLNRYFNNQVTCFNQFNWTEHGAIILANKLKQPTTVIGFSDGATAALTVANNSPHVQYVYAHSPMFRNELIRTEAQIKLFLTVGDTTPTALDTVDVYMHYVKSKTPLNITLTQLKPQPALPVRNLATFVMWLKNHQFHNCLRHLPQEILA